MAQHTPSERGTPSSDDVSFQTAQGQVSHILALPPELRLKIFSHLVKDVHIHVSAVKGSPSPEGGSASTARVRMIVLPFDHPPLPYYRLYSAWGWRNALNNTPKLFDCPNCTEGASRPSPQVMPSATNTAAGPLPHHLVSHPAAFQLLPLWRVCRQFNDEVSSLLFSHHNVFSFDSMLGLLKSTTPNTTLPKSFAQGVSKIWVDSWQDLKLHIDDLGIHGLQTPTEIHAARACIPPKPSGTTIYNISPLWLTDPYKIETESLQQKQSHWETYGTSLVVHDRLRLPDEEDDGDEEEGNEYNIGNEVSDPDPRELMNAWY